MNSLPPKKRIENRKSQEETQSSDESSSNTSESVSPPSISPIIYPSSPCHLPSTPPSIPYSLSVPMRTNIDSTESISESPQLRIKDEPEEIIEVDDNNRRSEDDSGGEDFNTEDKHSGHHDEDIGFKINNLNLSNGPSIHPPCIRKMQEQLRAHQANMHKMALQHQAERVGRPITNLDGVIPLSLFRPPLFFSPQFGFYLYPRVLLPTQAIQHQITPPSLPPLTANRSFSPRRRQVSPPEANAIQDGNNLSRRMTRIDDSYFESDLGKAKKKDAQHAVELGMCPTDIDQVVSMPNDEFQDHCQQLSFSKDQTDLLKDMRRRGKNKVAAQNCRKRKLDQIEELTEKVENMQNTIQQNETEYKENLLVKLEYVNSFGRLRQELEGHKKEYLGCSEHSAFTTSCLGTKGCEISVKLIRS